MDVKSVNGLNWIFVCTARSKWKIVLGEQNSQNIVKIKSFKLNQEERP